MPLSDLDEVYVVSGPNKPLAVFRRLEDAEAYRKNSQPWTVLAGPIVIDAQVPPPPRTEFDDELDKLVAWVHELGYIPSSQDLRARIHENDKGHEMNEKLFRAVISRSTTLLETMS